MKMVIMQVVLMVKLMIGWKAVIGQPQEQARL